MIYQPPAGTRDLLPLEVEQKRWINDRLQQIFRQWGYQRIVTSTLEWLDTLTAGGAVEPATVIQVLNESERTLGLRPELTASIARAAVTRMAGDTYPQRLCYRANVFRNSPHSDRGRQLEFYQAGVELLFAGGILADAEILLLLVNCLQGLGIQDWTILLGEAELTQSLLTVFPQSLRQQVGQCIANLDRIALQKLPLEPALKARALFLFDLRGKPEDVLAQVASLDLDDSALATVKNLKSLIELLQNSSSHPLPLVLDLSLLQTFNYYTGIIFKAISFQGSQSYILGEGGRYDRLLELYHPQGNSSPGVGFSFNIEDLHSCLLSTDKLPRQTPAIDWLVIPEAREARALAFQYARQLRQREDLVRVEVDLGGRSPDQIKDYARTCRITSLVWVGADGNSRIEKLSPA
ncbi:ATP phosphoribosyltransferase regulatory subunit [Myxosarcina sp. GI1(2024)]